ncbi:serine hydrolase domain-containing protein [Lutibaculum baratangense]|uniref:6-aminohexanoate-dimer hydrolase n=1 Tax=Lutibaculum baratangense AMV1 TaxID=631454 RepID=V4RKZ2_9HYPH|nr:serine hydrolase [Lutibaculum baratangense]ESR23880.1 6-aminohexanoate-dimer hydrolase [Lutibaculum baratangense AMV1]
MTTTPVMRGFPPEMAQQVTLANWRQPGFNRWAFHHVNEIIPSASIPSEPRLLTPVEIHHEGRVRSVGFEDGDGREWTLENLLPAGCTDAFVVMRHGRIVHEWYDAGVDPRRPHIVFSVSKSLTGILAGIAADRGLLDPEAPVTRYVPEAEGFAFGDCTVQHVLDMTVSLEFDEDYPAADGPFSRYRQAMNWNPGPREGEPPDLRSFLLSLGKGRRPHGEVFHYASPSSDMLGWILERATGRRFADCFAEEIWQPLGAERDAYVTVDRLGAPRTAGGICATARDLALVGEMMRRRGTANGRQIVPGWCVDDILSGGDVAAWAAGSYSGMPITGPYRSQWYVADAERGSFCAIGIHGQWLYIDPPADLVIVKLSSQPDAEDDALDRLNLAAFAALADALT